MGARVTSAGLCLLLAAILPALVRAEAVAGESGRLEKWDALLTHVRSSLDGADQPCYFWTPAKGQVAAVGPDGKVAVEWGADGTCSVALRDNSCVFVVLK